MSNFAISNINNYFNNKKCNIFEVNNNKSSNKSNITYVNVNVITMIGGYKWKIYATDSYDNTLCMYKSSQSYVWEVDCLSDILKAIINISEGIFYIRTNYIPLIKMYNNQQVVPIDLEDLLYNLESRGSIMVGD